jgi:hypothetical protein
VEHYKIHKENRHRKMEKKRQHMKVHGAGLRRILELWREKAENKKETKNDRQGNAFGKS